MVFSTDLLLERQANFTQIETKNVLFAHFRAIPVHSGLFPCRNHDIQDLRGRSGLLSSKHGKSGNPGLILRFWRFCASLHTSNISFMHVTCLWLEIPFLLFILSKMTSIMACELRQWISRQTAAPGTNFRCLQVWAGGVKEMGLGAIKKQKL